LALEGLAGSTGELPAFCDARGFRFAGLLPDDLRLRGFRDFCLSISLPLHYPLSAIFHLSPILPPVNHRMNLH
jgi:hypothetical protein